MTPSVLYRLARPSVSDEARVVALRAVVDSGFKVRSIIYEDPLGLDYPAAAEALRALGRFRREFRASFGQVPSLGKLCDEVDRFATAKQLELGNRRRDDAQ